MALDPVVNFFQSEIATLPVASGGTSIVVSSGDGAKLPDPSVDGAFNLTIYEEGNPFASPEIVRVTARSSDTLTVTRAQEGTTATTKTTGTTWVVVMFPTAKTIQDIDSAKLDVAGGTMTGTLTATKLIPTGNVTAGNGMYLPATNTVAFSTNGSERMRVDSSGNVGIGTTSPATKLDVSGSIRASTGILFGTDTAAANTLDDYEEGTFNFGIAFGGASVGVTYDTGGGKYTKIGRQVTVTGRLRLTSKGTSTGAASITGLPFTIGNSISNISGVSFGTISAVSFADFITGRALLNTTTIDLLETTNAGVNSTLNDANFANNSLLDFSVTYFTS